MMGGGIGGIGGFDGVTGHLVEMAMFVAFHVCCRAWWHWKELYKMAGMGEEGDWGRHWLVADDIRDRFMSAIHQLFCRRLDTSNYSAMSATYYLCCRV
jgi:hypothetical protein